ncbi:helix-turn-helix domain-containing protein [Gulosibacter hominis]|uniref:helix-turn-helix domain-containing protein n=1 Tax=Gulosibacter hominis TaxID=2770504 RepID=UPI0019194C56|nr:helix-turn-helix transcriptional regulator [Gulosibacter hominis]
MNNSKIRVRAGLLERQRELAYNQSLEAQARAIGISRTTLWELMRGSRPSINVVEAICDTYRFAPGEVLEVVADEQAVA